MSNQNFAGSLTLTIIPRKAKFIVGYTNFKPQDLAGSWLQDVLTIWMRWEILSELVRKSTSKDVPKNLVFHMHCRIKSTDFCPCYLVWSFWGDMIAFEESDERCSMNYQINWLHLFWDTLYLSCTNHIDTRYHIIPRLEFFLSKEEKKFFFPISKTDVYTNCLR